MIKSRKRQYRIVGLIVILLLALLCSFNITYAYFTAMASINGTINFSELNVKFGYAVGTGSSSVYTDMTSDTMVISPDTMLINRGDTFGLKVGNSTVSSLYFSASGRSCDFYVRFKLDAYKQNSTDTTNYGQYFQLKNSLSSSLFVREVRTNAGVTNAVYFIQRKYSPSGANQRYRFCDTITLLDSAPVELLNGEIKLTITFLASQADNGAYSTIFNDGWGYYSQWT